MAGGFSTKIDIQYADQNVVFGITNCCSDKKYSFWHLERTQAEEFLSRLKYFEKMNWRQLGALQRDIGLTPEIPDSKTFKMIDNQNTMESKLIEKYYFHFRVKQNNLFRVFGYQNKNIFYITHIDPKGELQH